MVQRSVPLLQWAGACRRAWLLPDIFAGIVPTGLLSLAAMLLRRHFAHGVPAAQVVMVGATS